MFLRLEAAMGIFLAIMAGGAANAVAGAGAGTSTKAREGADGRSQP